MVGITSSAGGTLSTTGSTFIWTVPTLAANGTATFTFRFRPLVGGTLQFTAGVSSDGTETDPSDNAAFESTIVNATGSTLAVTTTADSGPGSLRQAIDASNADSGDRDTIVFNIPGGGVPTITLQSGLDLIDQPVIIDGTTQPTTARVELNGNGLTATGLVISRRQLDRPRHGHQPVWLRRHLAGRQRRQRRRRQLPRHGPDRDPGHGPTASGIRVFSADNRIGGLTAAARNVISGNQLTGVALQNATATGNVVQGNYIGLNAAGNAALPNGGGVGGIQIFNGASGNTLGGAVAGAGNVVSGNTGNGISVNGAAANDNLVQGNFIGTDPTGAVRIANGQIGVDIISAQRTIVGGPGLARNVISGNGTGIQIRTNASGTAGSEQLHRPERRRHCGTLQRRRDLPSTATLSATRSAASTAGAGNVISGNNGAGINVHDAGRTARSSRAT